MTDIQLRQGYDDAANGIDVYQGFTNFLNEHFLTNIPLTYPLVYFYNYASFHALKGVHLVENEVVPYLQGMLGYDLALSTMFLGKLDKKERTGRELEGFSYRKRQHYFLPYGDTLDVGMYGYLTGLGYKISRSPFLVKTRLDTLLRYVPDSTPLGLITDIITPYVKGFNLARNAQDTLWPDVNFCVLVTLKPILDTCDQAEACYAQLAKLRGDSC